MCDQVIDDKMEDSSTDMANVQRGCIDDVQASRKATLTNLVIQTTHFIAWPLCCNSA